MKVISDILGILGILITVIVYQQKKRESLLISKLVLDLVWLLHYCFIGAYSGAAVAAIAAFRELVYVKRDRNNPKGNSCAFFTKRWWRYSFGKLF